MKRWFSIQALIQPKVTLKSVSTVYNHGRESLACIGVAWLKMKP
ncbi:hypothetical protein OH492_26900 [Vibrio chagasii]|nr:hypothetical protein [Vibrio chagasii]